MGDRSAASFCSSYWRVDELLFSFISINENNSSEIIPNNLSRMFNHVMSYVEAQRTVQESMSTVERIVEVVVVDVFLQ